MPSGAFQVLGGCGWKEPLSLTPALSRWEREIASRSPRMRCISTRGVGFRRPETARLLFPLPAGEGQGEGEPSELTRRLPLPEMLPPQSKQRRKGATDTERDRSPVAAASHVEGGTVELEVAL